MSIEKDAPRATIEPANEVTRLAALEASWRETLGIERAIHLSEVRLKDEYRTRALAAEAERDALLAKINTPEVDDWFAGVRFEAPHQILRWGSRHDAGKNPLDWFWLIGYLAQKAAAAAILGDFEKAKHHTISTAAALLNWHRQMSGETDGMRPGIDPAERHLESAEG